ncbi:MAG: radical SAM protein [Candidatus Omnitrophica bacterium]|nr:radical SAM protein [Candidatus Omnitrophota bacterium]
MKVKDIFKNALCFRDIKRSRRFGLAPGSIPFLFLWVTNQCNLQCRMCDQWKTPNDAFSRELSTEEWHSVIDSAAKMGTFIINITGGEPLLRPDIFQIIERIRKKGISCHLCTNGTLLNETIVKKMAQCPPNSISISIDSHEAKIHNELRGKDCFDDAVKGLRLLKKKIPRTKIGINHLICKKNFKGMSEMVPFAESLGVDRLNIELIHTNLQHKNKPLESFKGLLFSKEDMPQLKLEITKFMKVIAKANLETLSKTYINGIPDIINKNYNQFPCYTGYVSCAIDPFGRVSPCEDIIGKESVRDNSLENIWKSLSFQELRNKAHNCSSCWDTTHAELNIRCSIRGIVQEFGKIIKDVNYYLK